MQEITVTYLLNQKEIERLKRITKEYKKKGLDLSIEKQFENIMCYGCKYDIDNRFKFHEEMLGIYA